MFQKIAGKRVASPILLAALMVGVVAAARSSLTTSVNRRRGDEAVIEATLTYDTAYARLRSCSRWHVVENPPGALCFWVTCQQRESKDLTHALLFVNWTHRPWADRRGVVRIEPVQTPAASVSVDEQDTSYWRVIGDVHLAGDPALVREVADYLLNDAK